MMNSNNLLNRRFLNPKTISIFLVVISFLGFLDAGYLTVKHYTGGQINCYISIFDSCEKVTSSDYAIVLGIPIALIGALYYLVIFLGVFAYFDTGKEKILMWVSKLTVLGLGTSLILIYLQIFVIKALCIYCMFSALSSTLLFIFGMIMLKINRSKI